MASQGADRRATRARAGGARMSTTIADLPVYDNRVSFAEELIALAAEDERIVAVCNDSVGSSNLVGFREQYPTRLINVGIAEQDLVGVGAGLASAGLIPFVCGAAPFLTGRSLEQIKADVAYSQHAVDPLRDESGNGLRRARTHAPLGRRPVLAPSSSWSRHHRSRRSPSDAPSHPRGGGEAAADLHPSRTVQGSRRDAGGCGSRARRIPTPARWHRRDDYRHRNHGFPGGRCRRRSRGRRGQRPSAQRVLHRAARPRRNRRGGARDERDRHRRGGERLRRTGRARGVDRVAT